MRVVLLNLLLLSHIYVLAQTVDDNYPVHPDAVEKPGVPKGEVLTFTFENSQLYPGTWREYLVYIPAQYRPEQPACVYIAQDGMWPKIPVIFDNLIHQKEMPITIGVFVKPGQILADHPETAHNRYTRSLEYDRLSDAYARFLLTELLPDVEKHIASDGRKIRLSKDRNDRAIGGTSSGGIASFTAAWERPDAFSRVMSGIGSYVGIRGGERYSSLIRKYEPYPVRFFIQDGANDANGFTGDFWHANQMMERSLIFSGYEVQHLWGEGAHNSKHLISMFPEAMKWLWKDYPKPITKGVSKNAMMMEILIKDEDWKMVGEGYGPGSLAANALGEVYYHDISHSKDYKIALDGKLAAINVNVKNFSGTAFGPDSKQYIIAGKQVISLNPDGKKAVVARNITGQDLVVANNGNMYITSPTDHEKLGKLYFLQPNGDKTIVDEGLNFVSGITLTPDQTQLYVTEAATHEFWIYRIQKDGALAYKQKYGRLYMPDSAENAGARDIRCDREGRIYVATRMGIQILDQAGRVNIILRLPNGEEASNICFGGSNFDILYVTTKNKVYSRKLNTNGANPFEKPVKPSKVNI